MAGSNMMSWTSWAYTPVTHTLPTSMTQRS